MELLMLSTQIQKQYAVIGRVRPTKTDPPRPFAVVARLAQLLHPHITISDIDYVPPNYVIVLHRPDIQAQLLLEPVIHIEDFQLDIIPWNHDQELNLLPWIPGNIIKPNNLLQP